MSGLLYKNGCVQVWTDGCCFDNNTTSGNRRAGFGVWFNYDHPWNTYGPLPDDVRPTNNNAEIEAAIRAVEICSDHGLTDVRIYTDSTLLINGVGKLDYYKKSNYKGVKNKEKFAELAEALDSSGLNVSWRKVDGHKNKGNIEADTLARMGAEQYIDLFYIYVLFFVKYLLID